MLTLAACTAALEELRNIQADIIIHHRTAHVQVSPGCSCRGKRKCACGCACGWGVGVGWWQERGALSPAGGQEGN